MTSRRLISVATIVAGCLFARPASAAASGAVGIAHLQYPHRDWSPKQELIGTLALRASLEPTLNLHWDVAEGHGGYWTAGLPRGWSMSRASFSVTSTLSGLEHCYGVSGVTALETRMTVTPEWAGLSPESSLQRQWTWETRDLIGESRPPPGWPLALTVASPHRATPRRGVGVLEPAGIGVQR